MDMFTESFDEHLTDIKFSIGAYDVMLKLTRNTLVHVNHKHGIVHYSSSPHLHMHSSYEVHYIKEGSGELRTSRSSHPFSQRDIIIIAPNVAHIFFGGENGCSNLSFKFTLIGGEKGRDSDAQTVISIFSSIMDCVVINDQNCDILSHVTMLQNEIIHMELCCIEKLKAEATNLFIDMARLLAGGKHSESKFLPVELHEDRMSGIDNSYTQFSGQRFLGITLAEKLGLSQRQLSRLFREYYKKTFRQITLDVRMGSAKLYVTDTEMIFSEIALKLEYSSVSSFYKAFKKYYGMTPGEYRKQNRNHGTASETRGL